MIFCGNKSIEIFLGPKVGFPDAFWGSEIKSDDSLSIYVELSPRQCQSTYETQNRLVVPFPLI